MTLHALIFDVDGTLADTEKDGHRVAFNAAFQELGLDWHWDAPLYGQLLAVTGGKERIRYFVERFLPGDRTPADLETLVPALHQAKTRHYVALLEEGRIPLRPGVARLLREARAAGVRLAVATTTTPENVTALLRNSLAPDAVEWFDLIAAGDIVPAKKPAPDIYLWALEKAGWRAEDCLAVEDSRNGLLSSLGAGLKTVVTVSGYTEGEDFAGATAVLSDLGEPDRPCRALAGETHGKPCVDLELLRRWHAAG